MNKFLKKILKNCFIALFLVMVTAQTFAWAGDNNNQDYLKYKKIADEYCQKEDIVKAVSYYIKAVRINKNAQDLNTLGMLYYLGNDYDSSQICFEEALRLEPLNKRAWAKVEVIKQIKKEQDELAKIDSAEPKEKAPKSIHNLVSVEGELKNEEDLKKLHKIIDFIWSDKEGRILLEKLQKFRIQICLNKNIKNSCQMHGELKLENTPITYGNNFKNIPSLYVNIITIKESDISIFQEKNVNAIQNMQCITVVAHELCHLCHDLYFPKLDNTQEEELAATMIGLNIASRALTGKSINENTTLDIAYYYCNHSFKTHKSPYYNLESFGNFVNNMSLIGVIAPYRDLYCDLKKLKFKEKQNSLAIKDCLSKINYPLFTNYETVFPHLKPKTVHIIYLNRDLSFLVFQSVMLKRDWNIYYEDLFNLKLALFYAQFPKDCKDDVIPLMLHRYNNRAAVKYKGNF